MTRSDSWRSLGRASVAATLVLASARALPAQSWDLASPEGLALHNVAAEAVTFEGRRAIRITMSPEASRLAAQRPPAQPPAAGAAASVPAAAEANRIDYLAIVPGVELGNGTIEVDLAGEPGAGSAQGARGFVGVAFRLMPDRRAYDAFYVRPTNGRAEDQERRNHTLQYISEPAWPWYRLRQETPSRYESYADIEPGRWIHLKIEIDGEKARLYVDGAAQPALLVNDLKSGAAGRGQVALWIEGSTIAHFANLTITKR